MKERGNRFNVLNNDYIKLTVVYFLAHWLLLIVSGYWWDDWCVATLNFSELKKLFWETGAPVEAYHLAAVLQMPESGYRILTFLFFYIGSIFLYSGMKNIDIFSGEAIFWICAFYMTIPINDARITLICFGYAICLCLFWIGFYLSTLQQKKQGKSKVILRTLSLLFLFYSYLTESLLVFTLIIWMNQFRVSLKEKIKVRKFWKIIIEFIKRNLDYIILPFVFFIVKNMYFKPYGKYSGYNAVTMHSMLRIAIKFPVAVLQTILNIINTYNQQFKWYIMLVFILVLLLFYLFVSDKKNEYSKQNVVMFLIGLIVFSAGLYPYFVVRRGNGIELTGVQGRDSLLLGLGMSIMIFYFIKMLGISNNMSKIIMASILFLGIVHFNTWYLYYQEDYYHQLGFRNEIFQNDNIRNEDTFLCIVKGESPIQGTRFYSLNGNAYKVFGNQKRFFMKGIKDLKYLEDDKYIFEPEYNYDYNMNEYVLGDAKIDGVLLINNAPISSREMLALKYAELFKRDIFDVRIQDKINLIYYPVSKENSDKVKNLYAENELDEAKLMTLIQNEESY